MVVEGRKGCGLVGGEAGLIEGQREPEEHGEVVGAGHVLVAEAVEDGEGRWRAVDKPAFQ